MPDITKTTPPTVDIGTSSTSQDIVQGNWSNMPDSIKRYLATHGVTAKSYSVDQKEVDFVKSRYKSTWVYDESNPYDIMAKSKGLMPQAERAKYTTSEFDVTALRYGLPSYAEFENYDNFYKEYAGAKDTLGFTTEFETWTSDKYKSTWDDKYDLANPEDVKRKAEGVIPIALEEKYGDSAYDAYCFDNNLPAPADLSDYVNDYNDDIDTTNKIDAFWDDVAKEAARYEYHSQEWYMAMREVLNRPEYADLEQYWVDPVTPVETVDEYGQPKYIDPDTQEFDANAYYRDSHKEANATTKNENKDHVISLEEYEAQWADRGHAWKTYNKAVSFFAPFSVDPEAVVLDGRSVDEYIEQIEIGASMDDFTVESFFGFTTEEYDAMSEEEQSIYAKTIETLNEKKNTLGADKALEYALTEAPAELVNYYKCEYDKSKSYYDAWSTANGADTEKVETYDQWRARTDYLATALWDGTWLADAKGMGGTMDYVDAKFVYETDPVTGNETTKLLVNGKYYQDTTDATTGERISAQTQAQKDLLAELAKELMYQTNPNATGYYKAGDPYNLSWSDYHEMLDNARNNRNSAKGSGGFVSQWNADVAQGNAAEVAKTLKNYSSIYYGLMRQDKDFAANVEKGYALTDTYKDTWSQLMAKEYSDEEKDMFAYLLSKYGYGEANKFAEYIDEELDARYYEGIGEKLADIPVIGDATAILGDVVFGLLEGTSNIGEMFIGEQKDGFWTDGQTVTGAWATKRGGIAPLISGMARSVGQMLPIVLLSVVTQGAASSLMGASGAALVPASTGAVASTAAWEAPVVAGASAAQTVGTATSTAAMYAQSYQAAYERAIQDGKPMEAAMTYATMSGASEAFLQYLIGGVAKLGGIASKGVAQKFLNKISNPTTKKLVTALLDAGGEFTEEGLQELLDPLFRNIALGENNEVKFDNSFFEAGMSGAIISALFGLGTSINSASNPTQLAPMLEGYSYAPSLATQTREVAGSAIPVSEAINIAYEVNTAKGKVASERSIRYAFSKMLKKGASASVMAQARDTVLADTRLSVPNDMAAIANEYIRQAQERDTTNLIRAFQKINSETKTTTYTKEAINEALAEITIAQQGSVKASDVDTVRVAYARLINGGVSEAAKALGIKDNISHETIDGLDMILSSVTPQFASNNRVYGAAKASGMSTEQATQYAVMASVVVNALQSPDYNTIAKQVFGNKVVKSGVDGIMTALLNGGESGKNTISLIASALGSSADGNGSYVSAMLEQTATSDVDTDTDTDTLYQEAAIAYYATAVGYAKNAPASSPAWACYKYMQSNGYNAALFDLMVQHSIFETLPQAERAELSVAPNILSKEDYLTSLHTILQASELLNDAPTLYAERMAAIEVNIAEKEATVDNAIARMESMDINNPKQAQELGVILDEIAKAQASLDEVNGKRGQLEAEVKQANKQTVSQNKRAIKKAQAKLKSHAAGIVAAFSNEFSDMQKGNELNLEALEAKSVQIRATGEVQTQQPAEVAAETKAEAQPEVQPTAQVEAQPEVQAKEQIEEQTEPLIEEQPEVVTEQQTEEVTEQPVQQEVKKKAKRKATAKQMEAKKLSIAKRILKNADKESLSYATMIGEYQYISDSLRLVRLTEPLPLPEMPSGMKPHNWGRVVNVPSSNDSITLDLPDTERLKAYIKQQKSEGNKFPAINFGKGLPLVNANFLLDMMEFFPEGKAIARTSERIELDPIYFVEGDDIGMLVPMRKPNDFADVRTDINVEQEVEQTKPVKVLEGDDITIRNVLDNNDTKKLKVLNLAGGESNVKAYRVYNNVYAYNVSRTKGDYKDSKYTFAVDYPCGYALEIRTDKDNIDNVIATRASKIESQFGTEEKMIEYADKAIENGGRILSSVESLLQHILKDSPDKMQKYTDYVANNSERLDEADRKKAAEYEAWRAEQENEREAERKARVEEERQEKIKKQKQYDNAVLAAEATIRNGKQLRNISLKVPNSNTETKLIQVLMRKYGISVPLKTQGWIKNALFGLSKSEDGWNYSYRKGTNNSSVFFGYMNQLISAIESSNKSEQYLVSETDLDGGIKAGQPYKLLGLSHLTDDGNLDYIVEVGQNADKPKYKTVPFSTSVEISDTPTLQSPATTATQSVQSDTSKPVLGMGAALSSEGTQMFESKVSTNTYNAMFTEAERALYDIKEGSEDMMYARRSEALSLTKARERLEQARWAKEHGDTQAFDRLYDELLDPEVAWTGITVDTAMGLIAKYKAEGRNDRVHELAIAARIQGTESGRIVQALAKYSRTAEGKIVDAFNFENADKMTEEDVAKVTELISEEEKWADVVSETQEKLSITTDTQIRKELQAQIRMAERKMRTAASKAGQLISKYEASTPKEKYRSFRRIMMLLNPKTMIKNPAANVAFTPLEWISNIPAAGIDMVTSIFTGERTVPLSLKPIAADLKGQVRGWGDAIYDVKNNVNTRKVAADNTTGKYGITDKQVWKNRTMATLDNLVKFGLQTGDRPFFEGAYDYRISQLEALGKDVTTPEAQEDALAYALDRTFQSNTMLGKMMNELRHSLNYLYIGDLLLPFTQTPSNLAQKLIDYTPAGVLSAAIKAIGTKVKGGEFDQQHFVRTLGRSLTGTGIMALAMALREKGILEANGDDEKEREAMANAGIAKYSLHIGDVTIPINWAEPVGSLLVMGATLYDENKSTDGLDVLSVGRIGINSFFDNSVLQNVTRLMSGNDVARSLGDFLLGSSTQFLPSFLKAIASIFDPYERDVYDPNALVEQAKRVVMYFPGLRNLLPEKVATTGEVKANSTGDEWYMRFVNNFISPSVMDTETDDVVNAELFRLYDTYDNSSILLPVADKKDNTLGYTLTAEERRELQRELGAACYSAAEQIISSVAYENRTDEVNMVMLEKAIKKAKERVLDKWRAEKRKEQKSE